MILLLIVISIFGVLTCITGDFNAASDGYTIIVFPLEFYSTTEGKMDTSFPRTTFNEIKFTIDILIYFASLFAAVFLFRKKAAELWGKNRS